MKNEYQLPTIRNTAGSIDCHLNGHDEPLNIELRIDITKINNPQSGTQSWYF